MARGLPDKQTRLFPRAVQRLQEWLFNLRFSMILNLGRRSSVHYQSQVIADPQTRLPLPLSISRRRDDLVSCMKKARPLTLRSLGSLMKIHELMRARPWATWSNPTSEVPSGMLGGHEALLCYYLAKDGFTGVGTIIDGGSFLGKSAYFLAQGLRANPNYAPERDRIHCFDNFLVNDDLTIQFINSFSKRRLAVGDSTRDIFEEQVASVRAMVDVHAGDFHTVAWPPQPIEILFVDIAKSKSLCSRVLEVFFPHLIPGESVVIHQDYHHPWLPFIHVTMEYLAEYFELIVPRTDDSAAFLFRAPIPRDVLQRAIEYDFSFEEQMALMDRAISHLAEEDRYYVRLARVVLQFKKTHEDVLQQELNEIEQAFKGRVLGYSNNSYIQDVRSAVDEMYGWRCLDKEKFEPALEIADRILTTRTSAHVMAIRGQALLGLKRYREAEEQLRKALGQPSASGYCHIALARALMLQERFEEAEAQLLCGLRDPQARDAPTKDFLNMLGWVWYHENAPQRRKPTMAQLHREFPEHPEVWVLDGRLRKLSGDLEGAKVSLSKASELGLSPERRSEIGRELT